VALLLWSWGCWPDPVVDFGQQLYVAWRISAGEVLYRDLAYFHGPLSAYVGGLLMWAGGVGLRTLVLLNVAVLAALLGLLYHALRRVADETAAVVGCLTFSTMFAFAQYVAGASYNWICPYTQELTHGIALAVAALVAACSGSASRRRLAVAGLLTGLVFLTKAEVLVALVPSIVLVLALRSRGRGRAAALDAATVGAAALLAPALAVALFSFAMPPAAALAGVLTPYRAALDPRLAGLTLYRLGLGTFDTAESLRRLTATGAVHLACVTVAVGAAFAARRLPRRPVVVVPAFVAALALAAFLAPHVDWKEAFRPLPLWLVLLAPLRAIQAWRSAAERRGPAALGAGLTLLALGLLAKMALYARLWNYGFALAMPATVLLAVALVHDLPRQVARRGGHAGLLRAVVVAGLIVVAGAHLSITERWLAAKTHRVGRGPDAFLADARGAVLAEAVEQVASLVPPQRTLAVVPDGIMLAYLARRRSSLPYLNYVPTEILYYGEDAVLRAFRRDPPDFVAVVDKDTSDFGYPRFGVDYAVEIQRWIAERYHGRALAGAAPLRGLGFGIGLAERNPGAPP